MCHFLISPPSGSFAHYFRRRKKSSMRSDHSFQFVQILFSMEMYLLAPFARRYLRQHSNSLYQVLTGFLVTTSVILTSSFGFLVILIYLISLLFVAFVCPLFLVRLHKFKSNINGPWDEAVPRIPLSLMNKYQDNVRDRTESASSTWCFIFIVMHKVYQRFFKSASVSKLTCTISIRFFNQCVDLSDFNSPFSLSLITASKLRINSHNTHIKLPMDFVF